MGIMIPLKTVSRLSFIFLFQHSMCALNIIHLLQIILQKGSFPFQTGFTVHTALLSDISKKLIIYIYTFNKNTAKETTNIHMNITPAYTQEYRWPTPRETQNY
jgi:hypothetical protein